VTPPLTARPAPPCHALGPGRRRVLGRTALLALLALLVLPVGAGAQECSDDCPPPTATTEAQPCTEEPEPQASEDAEGVEGPRIPRLPGQEADDAANGGDPAEDAAVPRCESVPDVPASAEAPVSEEAPAVPAPSAGLAIPALPVVPAAPDADRDPGEASGPFRAQGDGTPAGVTPPPAESAESAEPVPAGDEAQADQPSRSVPVQGHSSGPRLSSSTAPDDEVAFRVQSPPAPQVAKGGELGGGDVEVAAPSTADAAPRTGFEPTAAPPLSMIEVSGSDEAGWQHGVLSLVLTLTIILGVVWFGSYAASVAQPDATRGLAPRRRRLPVHGR
jgi:hypothetical protein